MSLYLQLPGTPRRHQIQRGPEQQGGWTVFVDRRRMEGTEYRYKGPLTHSRLTFAMFEQSVGYLQSTDILIL